MGILRWLDDKILSNKRLEYVVKKYGPDFISTYVGGALLAIGTAMAGASAIVPLIAIPLAAGLISFVNQLDRNYKYNEVTDFYRDQIAHTLGKLPGNVTRDDLKAVAYGDAKRGLCANNVLKSELDHIDRERNSAITTHALSALSIAAFAGLVHAAPQLTQFVNLPVGQVGMGLGSLLLFQQVDRAYGDVCQALFSLKGRTAHDGITELQELLHKGQKISRMQIFTVMVAADRDLQKSIKERFGTGFDDLYLADKKVAMVDFGVPRGVNEMCRALNAGKMEAEDLSLTLCGMAPAPRYNYFGKSRGGLAAAVVAEERSIEPQQGLDVFGPEPDKGNGNGNHFQEKLAREREAQVLNAPGTQTLQ